MSTSSPVHRLSRKTPLDAFRIEPPDASCFAFPEKILQFGTGAFLRAFSDAFVDRANREGSFAGRIVIVGSTASGRSRLLNEQDGLFTLCVQGLENGRAVDRCTVVASVSRAIASSEDWKAVVEFARSPDLEIVISNTTEVGIRPDPSDLPDLDPPRSFPGKLTALLYERASAYDYDPERGLTVLCCELIEHNAHTLRAIVLDLADRWGLGDAFTEWIRLHNRFCNTLVDRIVAGTPDADSLSEIEKRLGYRDGLLVQAEPYSLWAIEGDDSLRERLPFVDDNPTIIVTPDIEPFRLRKVRILNGAHTLTVPVSLLCGNDTVAETMEDSVTSEFVRRVTMDEIVPNLDLPQLDAETFAHQVLDRFANPFVQHALLSIALQQTSKMDVRVVPSIRAYFDKTGSIPEGMALAFAAFLLFVAREGRAAELNLPADDHAETIAAHREAAGGDRNAETLRDFAQAMCADRNLWHRPLDSLPGFVDAVADRVVEMKRNGVRRAIEDFVHQTSDADGNLATGRHRSSN